MNNNEFNINKISLNELFMKNRLYHIPSFQRDYCWDVEQFDKLFLDTYDAFKENKEKEFFLGSLIFTSTNNHLYNIIDGQQRFTTINIILMLVVCCFKNMEFNDFDSITFDNFLTMFYKDRMTDKGKLLVQKHNELDYKNIYESLKTNKFENIKPENIYLKAVNYFKEKFIILNNKNELEDYLKFFFEKIILIEITSKSLEDCFKIFEIVNYRGIALEQADLIKNSLYKYFDDNAEAKEKLEYLYTLLNKFVNDNEDFTINDIFSYFVISKKSENLKRSLFVEFEDILNACDKNECDIIIELIDFYTSFDEIINKKNKYIYSLNYLPWKTYINTLLISIHRKRTNDENKFLALIRRFYYYFFISESSISSIKQTTFNLIKMINDENVSFFEISYKLEEKMKELFLIDKALDNLNKLNNYKKKYIKPLLASLEYENDNERDIPISPIIIDKSLTIDHVLPQSFISCPQQYRLTNDAEIEDIQKNIHSLGNLILLSGIKNSLIRDWNFEQKVKLYKGEHNKYKIPVSFKYTFDICSYKKRDLITIKERSKTIICKIKEMLEVKE